jgi:DNA-binding transcriptional regulator YdaS (Cro superfamily)
MNLPNWLEKERGRTLALARMLGRAGATVSEWSTGRKSIPVRYAPTIERLTNGEVTCEEMCPDVEWHVLRDGPRSMNAPAGDAAVSIQVTAAAPAAANDEALDAPGRA